MRRVAALWLLAGSFLVAGACGDDRQITGDGAVPSDAPPSGPERFTVVTWNVQDLFDDRNASGIDDTVLTSAQYSEKLSDVARVLRAIDADVVALQEVENAGVLDDLADGHLPEAGYDERIIVDGTDPRGIDVAFLTRLPVERFASHLGESFPSPDRTTNYVFARDALELFVRAGGEVVIVTTVHFISMHTDGSDDRRLAEAMQVRRIVDRRIENGTEHVVVAGDLNDVPTSPTLAALLDDGGLADVTTAVPSPDRWTFDFRGDRRQLDYVLASPAMAGPVAADVRILHGPEVDAASDHQPVITTFDLGR